MSRLLLLSIIFASFAVSGVQAQAPQAAEAQYWLTSTSERQVPPMRRMRIVIEGKQEVRGRSYSWWEMTMERPDGSALGIRVLSERAPLRSGHDGIGDVARYIFGASQGECLEYTDSDSHALLPDIHSFRKDFLPRCPSDCHFADGFANTGQLLGHVLVRSNIRPDFPQVDFSHPKLLKLRSELRISLRTDAREDRDPKVAVKFRPEAPLLKDEYVALMAVGVNNFWPPAEHALWIRDEPVFYGTEKYKIEDFYRSNFVTADGCMDEPATRFGWSENVLVGAVTPDVAEEAIRERVAEQVHPRNRQFNGEAGTNQGTTDAYGNKSVSWDTQNYTAWYQMAGGATGLVFEGRYVKRGYGWSPEDILGQGLENLTDRQQYDYLHAFMRGAARCWNAYWGTSIYPEGDKTMMLPGLSRAYDQGAHFLWVWNDRNLPYLDVLQVLKGLQDHIKQHPRGQDCLADTAIVLPPGYMLNIDSFWYVPREQLNDHGVSYGDLCAAATFEGILLSRAGVEYDYVNDDPRVAAAGYKHLIYIRPNGRVEWVPARNTRANAPRDLKLNLTAKKGSDIAGRATGKADYRIPRASGIKIDGDLSDWSSANWIKLSGDKFVFADNWIVDTTITIPQDVKPTSDRKYIGFTYEQLNAQYHKQYLLEGDADDHVVVTSVVPDGPAAKAGLRPGDVILKFGSRGDTHWTMHMWMDLADLANSPGAVVPVRVLRGGLDHFKGDADLSARVAFVCDDQNLYVAADVTDDVHQQTMPGQEFWRNDSVQIGFDPTLAKSDGYYENEHEIGFALAGANPVTWRWAGRRGQPLGPVADAHTSIKRVDGHTIYESAIPLSELAPLSTDMWPRVGMCLVINDSDDGKTRKARAELVPGAMTQGKKLMKFPSFEFDPSADRKKVSAAIMWNKRSIMSGSTAELTVAASSPETRTAHIVAKLTSLDDPATKPVETCIDLPLTPSAKEYTLEASTLSPPGRYRLNVEVVSEDGRVAAQASQPVFVVN